MTKFIKICAQGEVNVYRLNGDMPDAVVLNTERDNQNRPIVGHSEKGHHHVLNGDVALMEATDAPEGMRVLYALLDAPTDLVQDVGDGHAPHTLEAGLYMFRIAREFDPFSEQVRRVAD